VFWLALLLRSLGGLFDSSTSITRAAIADVTHPLARGPVFTWMGAIFALGRVLSSGVGGLLSGVTVLDNDYLLPCLVGAALNFVTLIITFFFLPETLQNKRKICGGKETVSDVERGTKAVVDKVPLKEGLRTVCRFRCMECADSNRCLRTQCSFGSSCFTHFVPLQMAVYSPEYRCSRQHRVGRVAWASPRSVLVSPT